MAVIKSPELAKIAGALAAAGAKWTPIYRSPTDANGVATGDPERIGCILGMEYRKGTSSVLKIDTPGTILRTDVPRFEGVLAYDCPEIQKRDTLCIHGARKLILDASNVDGMYWVLTLEE